MANDAPNQTTKKRLGPPRIFVEVIRDVEGGGYVHSRKEIALEQFHRARISIADRVIEECLAEIRLYG